MTGSTEPSARCRALLIEVSRYLNGELPPRRCRAIQRHLASCTCCATMAGRLRETIAACRAARGQELPPAVRRRAQARIKRLLRSA